MCNVNISFCFRNVDAIFTISDDKCLSLNPLFIDDLCSIFTTLDDRMDRIMGRGLTESGGFLFAFPLLPQSDDDANFFSSFWFFSGGK